MAAPRGLHTLARLHGVQTAYTSADGRRVHATPESLMAALRALGVPVESARDIPRLTQHRRRELADRVLEPVVVAWEHPPEGAPRRTPAPAPWGFLLRLAREHRDAEVRVRVTLEEGGDRKWTAGASGLEVVDETEVDGRSYATVQVPLPALPPGYHDLEVEVGRARWDALLLVAPRLAPGWDRVADPPAWGVFAPLYALHEAHDPGALPDFGLLDRLAERVAHHGGAVVGTLPVLAAFLDEPYEPSPYAPVSRLFWNELYADPARAPGWAELPEEARAEAARASGGDPAEPRPGTALDYRAAMAARRPRLEALARAFFASGDPPEVATFRARNPRADDYAVFRALVERHGPWGGWPDRLRARDVRPGDYDDEVARYHLYAQWLAERQLAEATERAASRGVSLYLDLPVGVHPDGYDVWRDRALFGRGVSAGAPPDPLAAQGQDWGFPPLHPEASRLERHRYFVASIRKHLRFARVLRIDHVMQLHRMFWVPGGDARNGVYVRYPAEELYAVLSLEAHRAGAVIVGEDLGTVPAEVRRGMKRHGLPGMYVAEFEIRERDDHPEDTAGAVLVPGPVPAGAVASIGTHDTPTFAGWWRGRDLEIRRELGLLEPDAAEAELRGRREMRPKLATGLGIERRRGESEAGPEPAAEVGVDVDVDVELEREVLIRLHDHMARSPAGLVLATMEDLWLEPEPQNVPGTTGERNWRRRSARPLDALESAPVAGLLQRLEEARREAR